MSPPAVCSGGHMPPSEKGGPSSAEIEVMIDAKTDAKMFKFMYELELRLDAKFEKARQQTKEDIKVSIDHAVQPLSTMLYNMNTRLEDGVARFDDHSERLDKIKETADQNTSSIGELRARIPAAAAAVALAGAGAEAGGWISVDRLISLLPALGSLVATIIASMALLRTPALPAAVVHGEAVKPPTIQVAPP